jgi:hypothetical protein
MIEDKLPEEEPAASTGPERRDKQKQWYETTRGLHLLSSKARCYKCRWEHSSPKKESVRGRHRA